MAVFVGSVEEVYPQALSDYEARWRRMFGEELSEDKPPSAVQLRRFLLALWPNLFTAAEKERINAARSLDDLESALGRFWLTPRRVRLKITEQFAGPRGEHFVLYTGLAGGDCGVDFKVGEQWLVEASRDDASRWIGHQCSVTLPISEASEVLRALRSPTK